MAADLIAYRRLLSNHRGSHRLRGTAMLDMNILVRDLFATTCPVSNHTEIIYKCQVIPAQSCEERRSENERESLLLQPLHGSVSYVVSLQCVHVCA